MKFKNRFIEYLHQKFLAIKSYFTKKIITVCVYKHIHYYVKIFGKNRFLFKCLRDKYNPNLFKD
jgi:hypothetical protein